MKVLFSMLTLLCLAIFFSSCQREVEGTIPDEIVMDSTAISQLVILDTIYNSGADTVYKYQFKYDDKKRVVGELTTVYNEGVSGAGRIQWERNLNYEYIGSDTLPYRTVENPNSVGASKSYNYLFYQNGWIVKDSLTFENNPTDYWVKKYDQLPGNRCIVSRKQVLGNVTSSGTVNCYVQWVNGNITKEIDSLPFLSSYQVITHTASYDGKPNPFKRVILPYITPAPNMIDPYGVNEFIFPTTNNIVARNYDGLVTLLEYTYHNNGLPKSAKVNGDGTFYKYVYFYTRL